MNIKDEARIQRFYKAFPELKMVYTKEQLINHLNNQRKEKKKIDKYIEKKCAKCSNFIFTRMEYGCKKNHDATTTFNQPIKPEICSDMTI